MKKLKTLVFIFAAFCLFSTVNVHADSRACEPFDKGDAEKNLTEVKLHYQNKQAYAPGEKVYLDLKGAERDNSIEISVMIRSTDVSTRKYYNVYLKNLIGSDSTGSYFIIPDDPEHMPINDKYEIWGFIYYKKTDEIKEYGVTPEGEKVPIYKELCTTYYTKEEDANNNEEGVLLNNSYSSFNLTNKKPEVKNILESITLDKNYNYFGGKMTFTVKTTEPIKSAYLTFTDRTKSGALPFFTVHLLSEGKSNEFTYTVDVPTYGINNVYDGTYKLEEIIFYDASNNKYTYNTNQEKAEEYNDKYVPYDLSILLGKPITDIIKESQFELKAVKLISNEAKVGNKVTVNFDWYYNSMNIRMQSVLLTFYDSTNNSMFSTYLKDIKQDTSIIIPSTAKVGDYTLKTVTITFDSYVGETNTIIIDKDSIADSYKSIFDQKLSIVEDKDAGLYFIAEELYQNSYEKIKSAKDNTVITINANVKSVIPAELFDAIKESPKQVVIEYGKNQWVFNGVDIESSKPVDVSMKFYDASKLESNESIKKVIGDKAVVLEFPENGELPGKALIRIKDEEVFNKLEGKVYYIYHIDENENVLNKVAIEVQKSSDGYIEFYINHNSKYVITNEKVNDSSVLGEDDAVANVNAAKEAAKKDSDSNNTILYIALGVCVVIIVGLVAVILRKPKKEKKEEVKEEPKKETTEEKTEEPKKE